MLNQLQQVTATSLPQVHQNQGLPAVNTYTTQHMPLQTTLFDQPPGS